MKNIAASVFLALVTTGAVVLSCDAFLAASQEFQDVAVRTTLILIMMGCFVGLAFLFHDVIDGRGG